MDIIEIWDRTLESVKANINSTVAYNVHIKSASAVSIENDLFIISVPTSINKNIIEHRYKNYIESSLEKITGQKLVLKIEVGDAAPLPDNKNTEEPKSSLISEINDYDVNPKYTFDNFVVGSSNEFANAAAKKTAESPGQIYNPLFIYGKSGLGKTHLMHAIGNDIKNHYQNANVIYVSSERFTNEFIKAVRENTTDKFRSKYRAADVLLVDDVQFMEHKEATQEEFFHTFNELFNCNKQIVLTCDRKHADLTTLTDRLKTRFGQGLTIDISIPNYETRVAILQKKAQAHNIVIDSEVFGYIADNIRSSVRELEGALLKVISMSEIKECEITKPFAEQILKSLIPKEDAIKITPKKIIKKVALYYNISESDILGKVKTTDIVVPRQVTMYLCRKLLGMKDGDIAKELNKDRTTVVHNIDKIKVDLINNQSLNSSVSYIIKDLQSN